MSKSASVGLKPRACRVCDKRDDLLRCAGCQAVYYCAREHQRYDWNSHKRRCTVVKRAREKMDKEDQRLRKLPSDMFFPPNVFENGVGHFWSIHDTRPYMRARYSLADSLLQQFGADGGRVDAVQAALDHFLDMLRLSRGDNMGVRSQVPALYIRLGRDQEAYDFMKWYATTGEDSSYDWGDMDLPFLDVEDADVLETPLKVWAGEVMPEMSHSVSVILLKLRALLDLQSIQNATRALRGTIPQEIIEMIRAQLASSVVQSRPELLLKDTEETARLMEALKEQIRLLYYSIDRYNPYFWRWMIYEPATALATRPEFYSYRTREEANLVVNYNYYSWAETPGATYVLETLSRVG